MDYRVYYNRRSELPWSVDQGQQDTEINVTAFQLHKVLAESVVDFSVTPGNKDVPSAWIIVRYAVLEVTDGVAHLFHDPDWRVPRIS